MKIVKTSNKIGLMQFDENFNLILPDTLDHNSALDLIRCMEGVLGSMDSILSKGYLKESNHPFLDKVLKEKFKGNRIISEFLEGKLDVIVPKMDLYAAVYHILLLHMYLLSKYIHGWLSVEENNTDLLADYEVISRSIYYRISSLIRSKIQKRGISIVHNTYTGFDTEYYLKDESKNLNELLSIQIAVNKRYIIKIPHVNDPYNSKDYINPLTGNKSVGKEVNEVMSQFDGILNNTIKRVRLQLYKGYDEYLDQISMHLEKEGFQKITSKEKSCIMFVTPISNTKTKFHLTNGEGYSFKQLLLDADCMIKEDLIPSLTNIINKTGLNTNILDGISNRVFEQKNLRSTTSVEGVKLSLSLVKNNYICCHLSTADLSVLNDFEEFKDSLDIVQKTFVTIGKMILKDKINSNIYIRDTSLLAPQGHKSLAAVGSMYGGEYEKVLIPIQYKGDMRQLLKENPVLFEKYAVQDALVTLKHANTMEEFNLTVCKTGVPLTLSSLGRDYILNTWKETGYTYQVNENHLLGATSEVITPQGLNETGSIGLYLSHYIGNYKGGRNESYMYGCDRNTLWIDYDLTSAYTTAMCMLGDPDYGSTRMIKDVDWESYLTLEYMLYNYVVVKTEFTFPPGTKYPSIPCYLKGGKATLYPEKGKGILTGPEYWVARNQGCGFKIDYIIVTPFKYSIVDGKKVYTDKPFYSVIKDLQKKRREYPKKTVFNLLYKELGNSIYGNVVKGISNKKVFDIKTNRTLPANANLLSNPVLGCYITGLIRSLLSECIHNTDKLGGKVVSSTTDGFITDISNLENKLLELPKESIGLLNTFRDIRQDLSDNATTLEVKTEGVGVISWATRGQLGLGSSIKAATGFQSNGYEKSVMVSEIINCLGSESKSLEYIQTRLRSGKDIYNKGGHVTVKYADRLFSLHYDNRRLIQETGDDPIDLTCNLLDSKPLESVDACEEIRSLSRLVKKKDYNRFLPTTLNSKKYNTVVETAVRTFIKGLLSEEALFGLDPALLPTYSDIIKFVKDFEGTAGMLLSKSSISHLKNRRSIIKNVPQNSETLNFAAYIQKTFKNFKADDFFKK